MREKEDKISACAEPTSRGRAGRVECGQCGQGVLVVKQGLVMCLAGEGHEGPAGMRAGKGVPGRGNSWRRCGGGLAVECG